MEIDFEKENKKRQREEILETVLIPFVMCFLFFVLYLIIGFVSWLVSDPLNIIISK
jgi:hypothetical protein